MRVLLGLAALLLAAPASAGAPSFAGLRSKGYVVLPKGYLFPNHEDVRLHEAAVPWLRSRPDSSFEPYAPGDAPTGKNFDIRWFPYSSWDRSFGRLEPPAVADHLYGVIERLGRDLSENLPGESFTRDFAAMRLAFDGLPVANTKHFDKGVYFTANYVINGPGMVVYLRSGQPFQVPERRWSVITGTAREKATGIPATLHAAPASKADNRLLLQVRYRAVTPAD